jgi:hypothetical protein
MGGGELWVHVDEEVRRCVLTMQLELGQGRERPARRLQLGIVQLGAVLAWQRKHKLARTSTRTSDTGPGGSVPSISHSVRGGRRRHGAAAWRAWHP